MHKLLLASVALAFLAALLLPGCPPPGAGPTMPTTGAAGSHPGDGGRDAP